jgi:hypothetical protein
VRTVPPGAEIFVNGMPKGREPVAVTLATDSFADTLTRVHEIAGRLDGYEDEKVILRSPSSFFSDTQPFPHEVTLKLRKTGTVGVPPPPTKSARAASGPARLPTQPISLNFPKVPPRPDDLAVIIGNADYGRLGRDIPDVVPAYADAEGFKRYAIEALGVREGNIIFLKDATGAQMTRVFGSAATHRGQLFDWVKPERSKVHVYYAGHGAPGSDGGSAYLVPVDADAGRIHLNGYPLDLLYRNLGQLPAVSVLVVLEACFSGNSQDGRVLPPASDIVLRAKPTAVPAGVTVVSAGALNQVASWEENGSHSLFTKYFLTAMSGEADRSPYGNGDGVVDWRELRAYLSETVTYYARRYYGRDQIPEIAIGQ